MSFACGLSLTLCGGGCGDDGGSTVDAGTTGASSTDGPGTGPGSTGTGDADGSSSGSASTGESPAGTTGDTTGDTTDATSSMSDDTTTGFGVVPIDLVNDAWSDNGAVIFQGGFAIGECWASTFVPEAEHYPLEIVGAHMVVGGEDSGSANFSVAIWSVDRDGQPLEELSVGTVEINGDDGALDTVPLDAIGVSVPPITEGGFALVVCFTEHAGFPGIAADADGLTWPERNFIRLEDGTWVRAADLGVSGDFITRATIVPQAM